MKDRLNNLKRRAPFSFAVALLAISSTSLAIADAESVTEQECLSFGGIVNTDFNKCYVVETALPGHTWVNAEAVGQAMDPAFHLVSIHSQSEDDYVWNLATMPTNLGEVWIGFNDATTEGAFVWSDGTPTDYQGWCAGEPTDFGYEDFAVLNTGSANILYYCWNDLGPNEVRRSIWAAPLGSGPTNESPVADAGENQSIHVGQNVVLNGSGSHDDSTATEDLEYAWSFSSRPVESAAVLADADLIAPSFIADLTGDYVISLTVTDEGGLSSSPDEVTVSSDNTLPNANAGLDKGTYVGSTVVLEGSGYDADGDPIASYLWTFISLPPESLVTLVNADSATPEFTPDIIGTYVAQLIVNDGYADSNPDEVSIVATTAEQYVQQQAIEALNVVNSLPSTSVTTTGNQTALGNFLLQVVDALNKNNQALAVKKLEGVLERTDGCALRGQPDAVGGGKNFPIKDYIDNCYDQAVVYPVVAEALEALNQ